MAPCCKPSAHGAPPPGQGWRPLFNGKDLSGWKIPAGDNGHWKVVDGVIDYDALSEAPGEKHLWTEESFGDFTLSIDWRIKETKGLYPTRIILPDGSEKTDANGRSIVVMRPNADSGLFLRGSNRAQVNIWCWSVGSGELWGYRRDRAQPPSVRAACVPKVRADKPVGEWNTFVITVKGNRVSIALNGTNIIEHAELAGLPASGPIGLQHHGGMKDGEWVPASSLMQFRNIYLRPEN